MDSTKNKITKIPGLPLAVKNRKYATRLPISYLYFNVEDINQKRLVHPEIDIHIVLEGRGAAVIENKHYNLEKYSVMVIPAGKEVSVSSKDPWRVLSFSYDVSNTSLLKEMEVIDNTPVWQVKPTQTFLFLTEEIQRLAGISFIDNNAELIDSLCESLLVLMQMSKGSTTPSASVIEEIAAYLGEHYRQDIKIEDLCHHYKLSRTQFFRLWKEKMGMPPLQYITFLRLKNSEFMLKRSPLRVNEIAYSLGYKNPRHFSTQFHKLYGLTPRQFRKQAFANMAGRGTQESLDS